MKHNAWMLFAVLFAGTVCAEVAPSSLPQPSFYYYGQVRDAYGNLYRPEDGGQISAYYGDTRVSYASFRDDLGMGVNFILPIATGGTLSADSQAVVPLGAETLLRFVVTLPGSPALPAYSPAPIPAVTLAGGVALIQLFTGEDPDGAGLPLAWREDAALDWFFATGVWIDAATVTADGDLDGDGVSNYAEFIAGTSPSDSADFFSIKGNTTLSTENADGSTTAWFALRLPFSSGRTYRAAVTDDLASGAWDPATFRFSASPAATAYTEIRPSQDDFYTVYFEMDAPVRFFRFNVQ